MVDGANLSIVELARLATVVEEPERALEALAALRVRLADLEEFQVENALRQGWSWARIGCALGRTKQAAHKRYGKLVSMPKRAGRVVVTADSQRVVALARRESTTVGHPAVGPAAILLGLVAAGAGPDGLSLEDARSRARRERVPRGGRNGISTTGRNVLERSLDECLREGSTELRPEHLLRAVLRTRAGAAVAGGTSEGAPNVSA